MIYTDMEHLDRYRGICPQLDTAIGYLMENGLEFLVPGRNEVDGEAVFVNRFHYATIPQEEAAFEAHEVYADIHLLVEGREFIGVTPIERLTVTKVDREADNIECRGPVETKIPMEPGKARGAVRRKAAGPLTVPGPLVSPNPSAARLKHRI